MTRIFKIVVSVLLYHGIAAGIFAQHDFIKPREAFAIEISLPNTDLKRLPMYRNAVLSLAANEDYIVGGTSAREGLSPYIYVASISQRDLLELKDLEEVIQGQKSIQTGFCRADSNSFYAGTMPNKNSDGSFGDGHIIQVKIDNKANIEIRDLGIPVPGEGVFSMILDTGSKEIYGISHPTGIFFRYSINSGNVRTYNDLKPTKNDLQVLYDFAEKPEMYLGKKLIQDNNGIIYGSMPINNIFCFDPENETFKVLKDAIPAQWGRRTLGQVESWAKDSEGKLYGGCAGDGQLFELDPETKKIKNLGKPIMANGMKALVFGSDGLLYGIAGTKPAENHLFTWSEREGFNDLGNPRFEMSVPGVENSFDWRAFQIGSLTLSEDGRYIIMGEDEDLSQLMVFRIETK